MKESVWIIYSDYYIDLNIRGKTVKGITYTRDQAIKFAEELAKKLDPKFGIQIQKWEMDAEKPWK